MWKYDILTVIILPITCVYIKNFCVMLEHGLRPVWKQSCIGELTFLLCRLDSNHFGSLCKTWNFEYNTCSFKMNRTIKFQNIPKMLVDNSVIRRVGSSDRYYNHRNIPRHWESQTHYYNDQKYNRRRPYSRPQSLHETGYSKYRRYFWFDCSFCAINAKI